MKHFIAISLIFTSFFSNSQQLQSTRLTALINSRDKEINKNRDILNYVNPFIGTGAHGHTYPGAVAPFGFMQLSPDTRYNGWDGCSGYHYTDTLIYGFSHTHLSGTGVEDYNDLLVVPQIGTPKIKGHYLDSKEGYGSTFSHKNETASPGYYSVLMDNGIKAELTATTRSGIHRYTFPAASKNKFILLDLSYRDQLLKHSIEVTSNNEVMGMRISKAWAKEQHFYFYLKTSSNFISQKLVEDGTKLLLEFDPSTTVLEIKVGMSAVDEKGAFVNYSNEISQLNFDQVRAKTETDWVRELHQVLITTNDVNQKTNFYTALYHSYIVPNVFSDVDGRYRGMDQKIHSVTPNHTQYTVFSLWDTYRATHPWYTLFQKRRTIDFINTFKNHYEQSGDLTVWELAANETDCMIGYHTASVIADAYVKGIKKIDVPFFINALQKTANIDELGKVDFNTNGFISNKSEPESVSKTLEYAYDSWCIYTFLKAAQKDGHTVSEDIIATYYKRSFNFINLFDKETGFMRPRNGGVWHSPFKPEEVNFNYTEANSWQYSLYAPQAIPVLRELLGGQLALEKWLDALFNAQTDLAGNHQVDITGLIGQYAHGNEPSHHMAYLYNYTDSPEKTAVYVDSILYHYYQNTPEGLSGNEDCGQMSSWFVFSSLGFYPVAPGNAIYDFGRPIFDKAEMYLENGHPITIVTKNNSRKNKYIQKIYIDKKPYNKRYITHEELEKCTLIEFEMGPFPSQAYRTYEKAPSMESIPSNFVTVPSFKIESESFDKQTKIEINRNNDYYDYYYTLDGTQPTIKSKKYKKAFTIKKTTTLKVVAYNPRTKQFSEVVTNNVRKKPEGVQLTLHSTYYKQYAASGDGALIDGLSGTTEFRCGDWQGYFNNNPSATITFNNPQKITTVGLTTLESTPSWIFAPKEVVFEVTFADQSTENYSASLKEQPRLESPIRIIPFEAAIANKLVKKITFTAINFGPNPEWHRSPGFDTFIFLDEFYYK